MKWLFFILVPAVILVTNAYAQKTRAIQPDIKIKTYVTDRSGTLSSSQISSLEQKLTGFDKESSTQIVVWMESSIEGGSLEDRSFEIAEQNGVGQKSKNNGVLLYIAKDDRKLRIEVGYGLEGALPDAVCDKIIRKEITPYFKQSKFYEGINAGVDAILKASKGEYTNDKSNNKDFDAGDMICGIPIVFLIFGIFVVFFMISIVKRMFGRNRWTNTRSSGCFPIIGGISGGSSDSSWSSGSSWSGGGFSGGGGSFGGGGASGSW